MNILIAGVHGFVGSNIVAALKDRYNIWGLDIVSSYNEGVISTFFWDSFFELDNLPDFDVIIHLAGKAHDTKNHSRADEYFAVNYGLTCKIYEYFMASSASKFIFFSSVKAAADTVVGDILTEDVIPDPKGPYGESKIAAEKFILSNKNSLPKEKKYYIFRPCMIHGPGNKGNLNLLYSVVSKGIPWPLGAFDNKRSFTSIGNLIYIIDGFINSDVTSGIYNIGDDEPISTNELISLICIALSKKARIWKINRGLMAVCAKCGSMLHLPLNTERLNKLVENYVVSNAKIKKALNVDKLPVSTRDGILFTIKSFQ